MDEQKAAAFGTASPAGDATANGALRHVESPAIAPAIAGAAPEGAAPEAAKLDHGADERREDSSSAQTTDAGRDIVPPIVAARERAAASAASASARPSAARRRFSKFKLLAASLVVAAAVGAMAGVFGATSMARLASDPAPVPDATVALQSALTQLRLEVAALKAGVDASGRSSTAQYNKLTERFERIERAQSAAPKSDALKSDATLSKEAATAAKDVTGTVTPANPSVTPAPVPPLPAAPLPQPAVTPSAIVPGWAVRDVYRGVAMLQSRIGGMVEVAPGDTLPGLGRIEAIRRQDGRWVVITSRGMIVSMR